MDDDTSENNSEYNYFQHDEEQHDEDCQGVFGQLSNEDKPNTCIKIIDFLIQTFCCPCLIIWGCCC